MYNLGRQMAALAALTLAMAPLTSAQIPVDDLRVRQLEADVRRLQQQVDAQARRIEDLERAVHLSSPSMPATSAIRVPDASPVWLTSANWDRIKTGMSALEVIAVLGRPTSTRNDDDGKLRLMFYAMELGPDKFLSGTIRLDDSGVVEINRPVLK